MGEYRDDNKAEDGTQGKVNLLRDNVGEELTKKSEKEREEQRKYWKTKDQRLKETQERKWHTYRV